MDSGDGNCIKNGNNSKQSDEADALENNSILYQQVVASMPSNRTDSHYNMNHKHRGVAIIFNHEHFTIQGLKSRTGTMVDCHQFIKTLKKLGFNVLEYQNLNFKELNKNINEVAAFDHSDYDCLVVAVLSHGEMGILYARDTPYKPDLLWAPFTAEKCPSLAGKPKLFFIQACQGDKLDQGVTLSRTETDGHVSHSYRIPTHADFLIAYSTVPGFYSWRNTTRGSWFMQALCQELEENGFHHDLLTLLTFVCQRVAIDYESNTPDNIAMHLQKQIPCITSMLTRLLKFTRNGSECKGESSKGDAKSIFYRFFNIGKSKS